MSVQVPKGYKQTEVGVIPEDWECQILDELAKRGSGHTPNKKIPEYWNGSIKWISLRDSDVLDNLFIEDTAVKISKKGLDNSSAVLHPAGTVVLSRDAGVGKSAIMKYEMAVSQHFMAWQCNSYLNNKFLYFYLQSKKNEFERIAMGSTIKTIGLPYFKELKIPKPSIEEQLSITEALSDADALIESLEQLIAKKRQIKQGAMQELLTGQRRLPGFSGEWKNISFNEALFRIKAKKYQIGTSDYNESGLYPVVDQSQVDIVGYSDNKEKLLNAPQDGLIVFGDHTCVVKYVDFDFLVGADGTQILCANDGGSTKFYYWLLNFDGVKPTGYNRHYKFLQDKMFQVPDLEEQEEIANQLFAIEHEINALQKSVGKHKKIKQSMMQELLTGRIRLL